MLSVVEIDRERDLAYILLQPELRDKPGGVARSVRVADDIVLDLDAKGQLIGIELLQASARIDLDTISEGRGDLIVGVKEAADLLGVERSNFIRDYANKPQFPAPIAELASGRLWLRIDIERFIREKSGSVQRLPLFNIGDLVALRSDPGILLPVLEVIPGGAEYRYRVFHNNAKIAYYERQLQRVAPETDRGTVTAAQLRAHLTGLQIISPSTTNLFSLRTGRVEFVPYQYRPVLRMIRSDRPRLLIADEVGVGKTIETGLILKELRARMNLSSVLVICPRALIAEQKWSTEMRRFDEVFTPLDGPLLRHCLRETDLEGEWPEQYAKALLPFSLFDSDLVLGTKNGKRGKGKQGLLDLNPPPRFDLVVVDEAHHLRNPETFLHQGVRYFCDNATAVLLLTATPVQLGSDDLFTLLNVLRPDLVIDKTSFEQMAAPNPHINAAVRECRKAQTTWKQDAVVHLDTAAQTDWGRLFLRDNPSFKHVVERLTHGPSEDDERVGLTRAIEELYTFSPLINRTRRRDIGEFTTRKPETVTVEFTEQQKQLHDGLLDVIAKILVRCHGQQNVGFMMTTIRRQAASCLYGLTPLLSDILNGKLDRLEHMETNVGDPEPDLSFLDQIKGDVSALLEKARNLDPHDPKVAAFTRILIDKAKHTNNKALVFSTFRHTLAYLERHVQQTGLRVGLVHGNVPDEERTALRQRFSLPPENPDAIDVMLSSEVGCEGLDFQFCDLLVNYDLPWNPMRIEQRIGRIDRYGQQSSTVAVVNLVTPGTVDAEIYERCLWRIGVFQHAVGGNEEILGTITKEIHDIAESFSLTEQERTHRLRQLSDNAIRRIREEEELESQQADLFGLSVPKKAWREEIEAFETFWLSSVALQGAVEAYLAARLESDLGRFLGDKPLKTLRLNQEARGLLLEDFKSLPRSIEPLARDWEKWLRGNQPTLAVTFDQQVVKDNPKVVHLSVLHPLVRQAARFLEIKEPKHCSLRVAANGSVPAGTFHFALYRWTRSGIKPDESLVPVALNEALEAGLLKMLESAEDDDPSRLPEAADCDTLDARHHSKWLDAQAKHIVANRDVVEHRIHSLGVSHATRRKAIEEQISRATNDKIVLMKQSELSRADADIALRIRQLKQAANSGDIHSTPVAFGTLRVDTPRV